MKHLVDAVKAGLSVTARGTETVPLAASDFANPSMWAWLISASGIDMPSEEDFHNILDYDDIVINVQVVNVEGVPTMASLSTVSIKEALAMPVTAADPAPATTEKVPLQPIDLTQKIEEKKPKGLEYKDVRVVPLEEAELAVSALRAFRERYKKLMDIQTQLKSIQTIADTQKTEFREQAGEPQIIKEINEYKDKFGEALEELNAEMPTLLESGDVLMGIVETIKEGSAMPSQKLAILQELIKQKVPEKVEAITKDFDNAVRKVEIAGDTIVRTFKMYHPSKTFRQEVKEYHTKGSSVKQAGIGETLLNLLKSAWTTVSDAISSFLSSSDDAQSAIDSVIAVAREQGIEG